MYLKILLIASILPRVINADDTTIPPKPDDSDYADTTTATPGDFDNSTEEMVYIPPIPRAISVREDNAGGFNCHVDWYPYLVYVHRIGAGYCAGTILAPSLVLTAGHCCYGHTIIGVYAGYFHDRNTWDQFIAPQKAVVHGQYDNDTFQYDACVIKLETGFEPSKIIKFISLAMMWKKDAKIFTVGYATNHTSHNKNFLELAAMPCIENKILSEERCKQKMTSSGLDVNHYDPETMICTEPGYKRSANRLEVDAGGPTIMSNKQIGISSFLLNTKKGNGLSFHAKIDAVFDFITAYTRSASSAYVNRCSVVVLLLWLLLRLL